MKLTSRQLIQIGTICESINDMEENLYIDDRDTDATIINSTIDITSRATGDLLGHIQFNNNSMYVFFPLFKGNK